MTGRARCCKRVLFWRGMSVGLGVWGIVLGTPALGEEPASGPPSTMPAGWTNLAAGPFFAEVSKLVKATPPPTKDHQREVVEHAWTRFFNDPQFTAEADWPTIERAMSWALRRWELRITGTTDEEKAASRAQLEEQMQALRERMRARVAQEESILQGKSYADVVKLYYRLRWLRTEDQQLQLLMRWMDLNDWRQTNYQHLNELLSQFLGASKGPVTGARWSGFITAPATGQYTLSQLRQYRGDPVMKIWVGGNQVLDSTPTGSGPEGGNPDRFRSQPVSLTAGQKVSLQVEIALDPAHLKHIKDPDVQFGAGLLWESSQLTKQLVPESALSPPD